jgi:hypothetical protein
MQFGGSTCSLLACGFALALGVGLAPAASRADPAPQAPSLGARIHDGGMVAYDAALLRPVGAIRTVAGSVIFLPMALLALPGGRENVESAFDQLVAYPFEQTFQRPLGEF